MSVSIVLLTTSEMHIPSLISFMVLLVVNGGFAAVNYHCFKKDFKTTNVIMKNAKRHKIEVEEISFDYCAMLCASTAPLHRIPKGNEPLMLYAAQIDEETKNQLHSECWCRPEGSVMQEFDAKQCISDCPDNPAYPCTKKDDYIAEEAEIQLTEPVTLEGYTLIFNEGVDEKDFMLEKITDTEYTFGGIHKTQQCFDWCMEHEKDGHQKDTCRLAHVVETTAGNGECYLYRNIKPRKVTPITDILVSTKTSRKAGNILFLRSLPYLTQYCNVDDKEVCSMKTPGAICAEVDKEPKCVCPETHFFKLDHCEPKA